ncbi:MAG: carboxypeptidase-like regulatory domain-containing protein [Blastocatellia bacterium]
MSCLRLLCALTGAWLLASSLTLAQTATSIIHGNFRDGNGASLVNAAVTATLTDTNSVYRAVTNADGNYIIPGVRPGQYMIIFDLPGFRKAERAGVRLEVSQQARGWIW